MLNRLSGMADEMSSFFTQDASVRERTGITDIIRQKMKLKNTLSFSGFQRELQKKRIFYILQGQKLCLPVFCFNQPDA